MVALIRLSISLFRWAIVGLSVAALAVAGSAQVTTTPVQTSQNPPTSSAVINPDALRTIGIDPNHEQRLGRFLAAMTPAQKVHSTLYPEFYAGPVLDDVVNGSSQLLFHDPWAEPVDQVGIMNDLRTRTCAADAVILGDVVSATSNPTQSGTYLFTDYEVRLADLVKRPAGVKSSVGQTVLITRAGGELTVEGKQLQVWPPAFPRLEKTGRYMLFAHFLQTIGTFHVKAPEDTLLVQGTTALRLLPTGTKLSGGVERDRIPLAELVAAIKGMSCR